MLDVDMDWALMVIGVSDQRGSRGRNDRGDLALSLNELQQH